MIITPTNQFVRHLAPQFNRRGRVAAGSDITVDIWQTFEGALDAAGLQANDNNASATWTVDNASSLLSVNASAERATISTVNTGSDTGAQGLKRVYTSTALGGLICNFGADKDNASIGFWIYFNENPGNNHILIRGQNNTGSDSLEDIRLRSATRYIGWGASGNSNGSALSAATWYWVTIQYNRNATSYLRVYDTASALVGSEATATAPNIALRKLFPFNYNAEISDGTLAMYMDDLVVDFTDSTFPLGP